MTKRRFRLLAELPLIFLLAAAPLGAQQTSTEQLRKDIEALSQSVKAMQKDLQEIKTLLMGKMPPPPPQNVLLDLGANPVRGERTAKLTMVEFSDYQWPFCSRHVRETAPQIEKEYISTGKLKVVFADFPLESIHKSAFKAAEAANCAGEQGKYWQMHDRIFANQQTLEPWKPHAEAVGLDIAKFDECMNSGRQAVEIRRDIEEGQKAGVTGAPSFFLAYTDPKSTKIMTVTRLVGAQPYAAFKAAIDKLLAGEPEAPKEKGADK